MQRNGRLRAFAQGVDLRGPLALSHTQRDGGARLPRKGKSAGKGAAAGGAAAEGAPQAAADGGPAVPAPPPGGERPEAEAEAEEAAVTDGALQLVRLLRDAAEVRAPPGLPCEGKVVSFDNAVAFVARQRRMRRGLGAELARPRVTFHWTAQENFQSIVDSNLRVPDPEAGVRKKHGAAFGRGIYTCPDYKMAKEDFSYGTSATFVCLSLPGRQLVRQPGRKGLLDTSGPDFDSVIGHLSGRNCDTWVFPDSDQLLPCFLVDEIAIPAAVDKLREAVAVVQGWQRSVHRGVDSGSSAADAAAADRGAALPAELEGAEGAGGSADPAGDADHGHASRASEVGEPEADGTDPRGPPSETEADCDGGALSSCGPRPCWRRLRRAGAAPPEGSAAAGAPRSEAAADPAELPHGGDLQEAMRAQDRAAVRLLLAARDAGGRGRPPPQGHAEEAGASPEAAHGAAAGTACPPAAAAAPACAAGRRWGAKAAAQLPLPDAARRSLGAEQATGVLCEQGGDLLEAAEEFIAHQCNCVSQGQAQGLAEAVFAKFPQADVYRERASRGRAADVPGTVSVHGRVVNMYGQLLPGRPADDAPPGGWPGAARYVSQASAAEDTRAARLRWFQACLAALSRALPDGPGHSVAFPANVGCGLAGGLWPEYLASLRRWAKARPHWRVAVYHVGQPPAPAGDAGEEPERAARPAPDSVPGDVAAGGFWSSALFEVLRGGQWRAYAAAQQEAMRSAVRCADLCDEALGDASRQAALESLGRAAGSCRPQEDLTVRVRVAEGLVAVSLGAIISGRGFGEERGAAGSGAAAPPAAPVRLRTPAVRDGEVRLPEELDCRGAAPAPRQCGRVVSSPSELAGLAASSVRCGVCLEGFAGGEGPRRGSAPPGREVVLLACGHPFHEGCLQQWFEERRSCPACKRRFGHIIGRQPDVGTMAWRLDSRTRLAGHPDSFTIVMTFRFPSGRDPAGQQYRGRTQHAYLPHDERGKLLLELLRLAFRRRVLFDLRVSATDAKYWPAFNIHLKTATAGGPESFGFPDDGYFQRATEELRENGVTVAELA